VVVSLEFMPKPDEKAISKVKSDTSHAGKDAENSKAIEAKTATNADMLVILTNSFGLFDVHRFVRVISMLASLFII